jgi:hypothetical protein
MLAGFSSLASVILTAVGTTGVSSGPSVPRFNAASVFPKSGFEWLLRALLGVLAVAIARACWRRRVGREERQKGQEANRLADRTRELAQEKQRAEGGNRIKAQFLARISQDLRIPLNELLNTLERALMTNLTGEQQGLLERSKSSAREVLTRLGGVLDISAAEAEKLLVNRAEFSLRDLAPPGGRVDGAARQRKQRGAANRHRGRFPRPAGRRSGLAAKGAAHVDEGCDPGGISRQGNRGHAPRPAGKLRK